MRNSRIFVTLLSIITEKKHKAMTAGVESAYIMLSVFDIFYKKITLTLYGHPEHRYARQIRKCVLEIYFVLKSHEFDLCKSFQYYRSFYYEPDPWEAVKSF